MQSMDITGRIDAATYRELLSASAIPLAGSALASALMATALWTPANSHWVIGWVLSVFGAIAIRILVVLRSRIRLKSQGYSRSSAFWYSMSVGLSGLTWGLGGLFVHGASPLALTVIVVALQSMLMGGVVTLSLVPIAFIAFAVPTIVPMVAMLILDGGKIHIILAVYNILLFGIMTVIAKRVAGSFRRTWQLTFEKEDLVAKLTKAHEGMSILAETDGLTGLANRRRFNQALEAEFDRARDSGSPLSLIILDVDYFKDYNDCYGHVGGDTTLQRIGAVLKSTCIGSSNVVARYGGEEFAAILPNTSQDQAVKTAERVREQIVALNIGHSTSTIADHVTVSAGIATFPGADIGSTQELVALADERLYLAKAQGRNRVVVA